MLVFPRSVSSTAPEATSWAKTSLPSAEYRQDEQSSATEEGLKGTAICLGLFSNQGDKTRMGLCEHGDEKEEKPHPSPEQEGHIQEAERTLPSLTLRLCVFFDTLFNSMGVLF